jgi:hypothetical protein
LNFFAGKVTSAVFQRYLGRKKPKKCGKAKKKKKKLAKMISLRNGELGRGDPKQLPIEYIHSLPYVVLRSRNECPKNN